MFYFFKCFILSVLFFVIFCVWRLLAAEKNGKTQTGNPNGETQTTKYYNYELERLISCGACGGDFALRFSFPYTARSSKKK